MDTLELAREGAVARITLARPKAMNAMNGRMMRELYAAALQLHSDPQVRAVVITGAGKAFCAGGDLAEFAQAGAGLPALLTEYTHALHGAVGLLARMDAPVITAVNGMAAGAGFSLAVAADLALAAQSARFTMAYTRAGLTPDGSSTFFLARLIGLRRAQELMLTNRLLNAEEAQQWQLVNRVVPDAELLTEAMKLAAQLAAGATGAFGRTKRLLLQSAAAGLEAQLQLESAAIAAAAGGADGREGIAAFLEKRPAKFGGA